MEPDWQGKSDPFLRAQPLLSGTAIDRGFVVRSGKRGAKRGGAKGGVGAIRIRESYLRSEKLLFRLSETLFGGAARSEGSESTRRDVYVCPTAGFLHCYLELFERPEFGASFMAGGSGSSCCLLLLHSELAKLTGAAGALSLRQERRFGQLARSLPGTLIFFDKFCPDLRGVGNRTRIANIGSDKNSGEENWHSTGGIESRVLASCAWCREQLDRAQIVVLAHEDDSHLHEDCHKQDGVEVSSLEAFLHDFVGREAAEELGKRGASLRRAYMSLKGLEPTAGGDQGGRIASSLLVAPHPTKAHMEAMIANGEAWKGRLDVLEHNPREGVVSVGASGGGALEGWADSTGRTKVLVAGKEGMNRSIHGDTVAVKLLPKKSWRAPADRKRLTHVTNDDSDTLLDTDENGSLEMSGDEADGHPPAGSMPTGFVLGVLEEGRRPYVATIPAEEVAGIPSGPGAGNTGMTAVTAVPMDPRVPKIRLKTRQLAQIVGQRLVVTVDAWEVGNIIPAGHYISSLGPVGEVATEAAALLVECQASFDPFSFNALASLPSVPHPPKDGLGEGKICKPWSLSSASKLAGLPRDDILFTTEAGNAEATRRISSAGYSCGAREARGRLRESPQVLIDDDENQVLNMRLPRAYCSRWQDSGWRVQDSDLTGRRDFRGERVISVDPPGCQDIDDAMHVVRKPNGRLEVAVHIADVTHFVEADGSLDKEARVRATTVYLVHRRIDMLPTLLSSDLCSLHAGRDRLSVSVVWEAEEDGEDIKICSRLVQTGKIVKSAGHREPPLGQAGRDVDDSLQPELAHDLRILTRFARTMRRERTINGAVDLSQTGAELKFRIDPITGVPLAVAGKKETEIHHTIAELMILANSTVAKKIHETFASAALLRVHAPPDPSRMTAFEGVAAKVGVARRSAGTPKGLSETLAAVDGGGSRTQGQRSQADLLKSLAVRAMSEAEYVSSGALSQHQEHGKDLGGGRFSHFGLGLSYYTHFTSPIRRYADVIVHRLLLSAIGSNSWAAASSTSLGTDVLVGKGPGGACLIPPSSAPSVMDMEEAGVGRQALQAPQNLGARAGTEDASLNTDRDSTRMDAKASVSSSTVKSGAGVEVKFGTHPGFDSSTPCEPHPLTSHGDDLLDELLGLDIAEPTSTLPTSTRSFSAVASASRPCRETEVVNVDDAGDSALDALLGLDVGDKRLAEDAANMIAVTADEVSAPTARDPTSQSDSKCHWRGKRIRGDASPPFDGAELSRVCIHLNERNRRAKQLAQRCQEMFLSLFFKNRTEVVQGLVLSLRANGFMAYVPAFDVKGPVYLSDLEGQIQVDPALLNLPPAYGEKASKAFSALPTCRIIPSATSALVSSNHIRNGRQAASSLAQGDDDEALEVIPPPGSGGRALRLKVLDAVLLKLSCDIRSTQARLPKVRFFLAGVGTKAEHDRKKDRRSSEEATTVRRQSWDEQRHRCDDGDEDRLGIGEQSRKIGHNLPLRTGAKATAKANDSGCTLTTATLYGVLQRAVHDVIEQYLRYHPSEGAANAASATSHIVSGVGHSAHNAMPRTRAEVKKTPGQARGVKTEHSAKATERSELGTGRASFGGFVPARHTPAASLSDFSPRPSAADTRVYGSSVLDTLNDARVREYTQEATARAQRLGAEKRHSRIAKSKRHG